MNDWQQLVVGLFAVTNIYALCKGLYECKFKKNAFGLTPYLLPWGIFAWGDAIVFGLFWIITAVLAFLLKDWILFCLTFSVFWVVRSLGETIYWFNQQFSTIHRNPVENLRWHKTFHDDSIWYAHQIIWQCVTVVAVILSIYLTPLWLKQW